MEATVNPASPQLPAINANQDIFGAEKYVKVAE